MTQEHIYDRLNDSNNSNDGREIKLVQERPYKRKWTDKFDADRTKTLQEYQKQKPKDNRRGQWGHQIGRDSTSAQQKRQNVENAKKEAITKRCADQ